MARFAIFNSIFFLFLSASVLSAQELITDLGIYPPPTPPALPVAGGKITDPTFGTEILRVTDENDGVDNEHGYSYWPCFNMDNSIIYVYRVNGTAKIYDMDTATFTISNKREAFENLIDGEYPNGEDQIWSRTDKNIIYCHTTKKIVAYNVSAQTFEIVKDFEGLIENNIILSQMSCNADATKFAFSQKHVPGYQITGYLVWDKITDEIFQVTAEDIDEVQLDRTGNYLWIKTALQGADVIQTYITDLTTYATTGLTDNGPDYAPGHGDVGHEFIIGYENWNNRILTRDCSDPHSYTEIWNFESDWDQDMHLSLLAEDEDWLLVSLYRGAPAFPFTGLFENEILQISTDGSKQVRRLCHHQTDYEASGENYWASPRASMSYTGNYVMFTSNWGDGSRTDVFVLKIPAAQDTALSVNSENNNLLQIFPNPVSDNLNIQFTTSGFLLSVYDMNGKLWLSQFSTSSELSISLAFLPSGVYALHLNDGKLNETRKIIKF